MPFDLFDCTCQVNWVLFARDFLLFGTPIFVVVAWIALKILGPYLKGDESEEPRKPFVVYQGGKGGR